MEDSLAQLERENKVLLGEMSAMRKEILGLRKSVKHHEVQKDPARQRHYENLVQESEDHQKTIKKLKTDYEKLKMEKSRYSKVTLYRTLLIRLGS